MAVALTRSVLMLIWTIVIAAVSRLATSSASDPTVHIRIRAYYDVPSILHSTCDVSLSFMMLNATQNNTYGQCLHDLGLAIQEVDDAWVLNTTYAQGICASSSCKAALNESQSYVSRNCSLLSGQTISFTDMQQLVKACNLPSAYASASTPTPTATATPEEESSDSGDTLKFVGIVAAAALVFLLALLSCTGEHAGRDCCWNVAAAT